MNSNSLVTMKVKSIAKINNYKYVAEFFFINNKVPYIIKYLSASVIGETENLSDL